MKDENFIKCNFCDSNAKNNLQKVWVKYKIDKKGYYKEDKSFDTFDVSEPMGSDNLHLCENCFEKWMDGKI